MEKTPTRPELNEIATTRDGQDITRGYVDSLPYLLNTDPMFNKAGGLQGYESLLEDDQVFACFGQRRNAVISRPWSVTPGGNKRQDKKAAELVEQTLNNLDWDTVTDHMLYARFFGYAVAEVLWKVVSGQVQIDRIKVRDRRRFGFTPDNSLLLFTMHKPDGEAVPERKFWTASVGASHADEPHGRGLGYALYWPVFFKHNGAKFWAKYLEKFGAPTAVGKFQPGTDASERAKLLSAARAVTSDSGVILPEGVELMLLEATRGGSGTYDTWMHYWDGAIAKIILGQTMTTDDGSSYAQATVHYDVRQDIVAADADLVCQSANSTWVKWLVDYNLPGAAYPQLWRDMEEEEDLSQRVNRDKTLFDMGYKLKPEAVAKVYGDDYEAVQKEEPPGKEDREEGDTESSPGLKKEISFALPLAEGDDLPPSPVPAMVDQMQAETEQAWKKILDHVRDLVEQAPDLPTLRDNLLNAFSDLPVDELADVMSMGFMAAELAGRYDVKRESADA